MSLCILRVDIKVSMHETQGSSLQFFWLVVILFGLFLGLVPQLVHLGSHRPSHLANSVTLKEWNYNQTGRCSFFVQLYILKVILGTLS